MQFSGFGTLVGTYLEDKFLADEHHFTKTACNLLYSQSLEASGRLVERRKIGLTVTVIMASLCEHSTRCFVKPRVRKFQLNGRSDVNQGSLLF